MSKSILSIRNLDITFHTSAGDIHAIRGINLELPEGKKHQEIVLEYFKKNGLSVIAV